MSNIIHVNGDIFKLAEEGHFDFVVHGCNAQGVMGSGIAKTVRYDYPKAYQAYLASKFLPGTYSMWTGPKFTIVNAITQKHYLPRGEDHFEYEAFDTILDSLFEHDPASRWAFPYIGMGLAGGNATKILSSLEQFADKITGSVTLVRFT